MLAWLESTELSAWVKSDSLWGWPLILTVHALGTAIVIGLIFVINLRLLGLFETIPFASLRRLFPVLWAAFVVQFASGFALWMTKPTRYVEDGAFALKFGLVLVGILLTLFFYGKLGREGAAWQAAGAISSRGVKYVAASLVVWCGVLVAARLTAFL